MLRSDAKWSWFRSAQSEHFFVFWESGFGDNPNDESVNPALRVDINDMLEKIEHYYNMNADVLKFVTTGNDKSYLDKYKMEIYLFYQSEWMATGSGYDDVIGALWINPGTCQPVGSTIAHEIGHSFQYQVYCDKLLNGSSNDYTQGFRYGYEGSNGGNGFWEQCAQWQSFQNYPQEAFGYNSVVWRDNYHRHFGHEWMRYASYWLQYYWAQKHGIEVVGEIWNKSYYPEDPLMTYMRLYCNDNLDVLYTELYDYATHMVTYDIDGIRDYKTADANNYSTKLFKGEDDFYQIAYSNCPGTTGFNIIKLNLPQSGKTIDVNFQGLSSASLLDKSDPGNVKDGDGKTVSTTSNYNSTISNGGWRYGFVSVVDGVAVYSPMYQGIKSTVSYLTPVGTSELYFVVMGAPDNYSPHPWNEDELDDEQWPYKVQFVGTDLYGSFYIDTDVEPTDVVFTYNLSGNSSIADYNLGNIDLTSDDAIKSLAQAFVMRTSDLSSNTLDIYGSEGITPTDGKIVLGLLQNDGTYSFNYTASSGFYCTADGDVGTWGNDDPIWIEYDKESFIFTYGHKPGTTVPGQKYTIKPVLIYTKNDIQYKATFIINIQF